MSPTPQADAPRRGRPPRGREPLTRQRIVTEAMAVVEEGGLDRLTMRGLAKRLGVDAMSLYNHVDNRDALLDAIAESVFADLRLPPLAGDLRADVHAVAHAFRETALRHPRCAPLVLTRQLGSLAALGPVEVVLGVLGRAGFPPDAAVHALRASLAYVVGTLLREVSACPTFSGADLDGVERRRAELAASGLPHVVAAAAHLAACDHRAEFDFGLDLLVTALESTGRLYR